MGVDPSDDKESCDGVVGCLRCSRSRRRRRSGVEEKAAMRCDATRNAPSIEVGEREDDEKEKGNERKSVPRYRWVWGRDDHGE